jgi:glycerol-3-phosphate dehydrogenase (NAD(P)+)
MKICILGEGAWGTAVATLLAYNKHSVTVWCHDQTVPTIVQRTGINERYLPGVSLNAQHISFTTDIKEALCDAQWIFEAIPVKFLRSVLEQAKPYVTQQQQWVILSKGIEQNTLLFPSQILSDVLDFTPAIAVLAGPSFAKDLALQQLTAVDCASNDQNGAGELQKIIDTFYFKTVISSDLIGVQAAAALKNVVTLGMGILEGAGYTDNTQAFFFTAGLQEMSTFIQSFGGSLQTVYGLSGIGDLVLTSRGGLSRNLAVGRRLGSGQSLDKILHGTGYIPEGINTVQSVHQYMKARSISLPLCSAIYTIIFEGGDVQKILNQFFLTYSIQGSL